MRQNKTTFQDFRKRKKKDQKMSYFDDDPDSAELLMRDFDDDMFMDTTENNDIKGNRCFSVSDKPYRYSLLLHKEIIFCEVRPPCQKRTVIL